MPQVTVSRHVFFAHYTSYNILSSEPDENSWIPTAPIDDSRATKTIARKVVDLVTDRIVYAFIDANTLRAAPALFPEARVPDHGTTENVLLQAIRIDAAGDYAAAKGHEVRATAHLPQLPPFQPLKTRGVSFTVKAGGIPARCFFIVSRTVLPLATIEKFERARPPHIPLVDMTGNEHFATLLDGTGVEANAQWVLFVVDPITIAQNLTKKFYRACDDYLAITQPFEKASHEKDAKKRQDAARITRLKKLVADSIDGILSRSEKVRSAVDEQALRAFQKNFDDKLEAAARHRELTAHKLIHWIRTELWRDIDESYRQGHPHGTLSDDYEFPRSSESGARAPPRERLRALLYPRSARRV